ncbi:MAG: transketolase [Lachnospiraceae bacterium]|nr:transketolase [Lachnospiraceae bacterium]
MRDHVISELVELVKKDSHIYLICGDLGYVVLDKFKEAAPNNFLNSGIAEQNMTALAAGLAMEGNTVFTYSIGNFPTLRCIEQIRNDVCYHHANVKILAVGGGFVYGNQGVTHHATEDIAVMRALPTMRVYVPGDAYEAMECLKEAYEIPGPAYIRLARNKEQNFHEDGAVIDINKIQAYSKQGSEVNILTTGSILCEGIKLQKLLEDQGISTGIYSVPRVKPIDEDGIKDLAKSCKLLVTMEEHQIEGGLGGAVAEVLSSIKEQHAVLYRSGLNNMFSDTTGSQDYLRNYYNISADTLLPIIKEELGR